MCNKNKECEGFTYIPSKDHCWLKKPLRYPTKHHEEAVTYYKLAKGKLSNIFAKIITRYHNEERKFN